MGDQIKNKKARIEELKNLIKLYKKHLCDPNPCMNMGTCNEGTCTCAEGWTGPHCKEKKEAEKKDLLPSDGWYILSKDQMDRVNRGCDSVCQNYGLVCTVEGLSAHNGEIEFNY